MLYYTINRTSLRDRIEEEVSHVANDAYADNGQSLYDSIIVTEKDEEMVGRFIDDAINAFVNRTFDICKYAYITDTLGSQPVEHLEFYVPDFDETMEDAMKEEVTKFIVLFVCVSLFQTRRPMVVPQFTERMQAALTKAVSLLKSRKSPIRLW